MATCHSLHQIDDELVGDPLDAKMFEFTRWSFEESARVINATQDEEFSDIPLAVVRPPAGFDFGMDNNTDSRRVNSYCGLIVTVSTLNCSAVFPN